MPKKSGLNAEMAPRDEEPFIPVQYVEYTPEERGELRTFFEGKLWKKVINNVRCMRPNLFPVGLNTQLGPQIAINRLHQRQGWDLFEIALVKAVLPDAPRKPALSDETYPDAGRPDFEKLQQPQ